MSEISALSGLPNAVTPPTTATKTTQANTAKKLAGGTFGGAEDAATSAYQGQLTRLSSILSGLQLGASKLRSQFVSAASQVRSGTYQLDPLQISRSIVTDLLGPAH